MYESYYGFKANPFRIAPDPSFFFASAGHKRGLAYLRYGLHQGQGFVVVTGEPGTGKTILIQTLLAELSRDEYCVATITNTNLRAEDVLRAVAENFGIDQRAAKTKAELLGAIQRFLEEQHQAGRKSLLIVDEAQNLPPRSLEELRMLSNFQIGHDGLLQIVLAAQPQLRKTLAAPSMEQLSQRIIAGCHLKPISAEETRSYIAHRLKRVGWSGNPLFEREALVLIYTLTRGVPRLINILCDRVLLAACMEERDRIDRDLVVKVLAELKEEGTGAWVNSSVDDGVEAVALAPLPDRSAPPKPPPAPPSAPAAGSMERGAPPPRTAPSALAGAAASTEASTAERSSPSPTRPAPASPGREETAGGKARRPRPRIVKAVASAKPGQEGAARLVQVKWTKEQAAGKRRARGERATPPPRREPRLPEESGGGRAVTEETSAANAGRERRQDQEAKVIELPVASRGGEERNTAVASEERVAEPLDDLFEPAPPSTGEKNTAPALDDELFGADKGGRGRHWLMAVLIVVAVGGGVGYFMLAPGGSAPAPVVEPEPDLPPAVQAPTPPPAALEEGERGSIFDPRARVPAASAAVPGAGSGVGGGVSAAMSPPLSPSAAESGADALPEWELADLMYTFILAFENGNTSLFTTLFSADAEIDGHRGQDAIGRFYSTLFGQTEMRSIGVNDIQWSVAAGGVIVGEGGYETTLWYGGRDKPEFSSGRIELEVVRENGRLLFRRIVYL